MKKIAIYFLSISVLVLSACGGQESQDAEGKSTSYVPVDKMNIKNLEKEIEKREKALNMDDKSMDKYKARDLMEAYAAYGERFPNYENAADRMFKAGELAMGLGHKVQAIKYFEKVYNEYVDYEKRPYALFMKAFVLENQAMQYDEAKKTYEQFIAEFPTHEMVDDAEYSIKNMGKSPEELIREFEIQDSLKRAKEAA